MKIISRNNPPTCGIVCLVLGCFFLLKALMVAFFRTPIHDFVDFMIRQQVALASDSMMTELWTNPPVTPLLKVSNHINKYYNFMELDVFSGLPL